MRTKKSLINVFMAMLSNLVSIFIGLIAQKILVETLGIEYVGMNGLFNNVISMLAIAELGLSSAIIYNLYEPVANKNHVAIMALLNFYKKSYRLVSVVIALGALTIMPFLHFFVTDVTVDINIYIVYLLFIVDVIFSYLLSYRRSILYADQRNYLISIAHLGYLIGVNATQIAVLLMTKNYYLYLIIKIIFRILENGFIHILAGKKYPFINNETKRQLSKEVKTDIFKKIRGLLFHKIGTFIVLGTDNLVISMCFGISTVGVYSNYYVIINALNLIFGQAINAVTPSIGNLFIEKNSTKTFYVFKRIRFMVFWIACFSSVGLLIIAQPFVELWLGKEFLIGWAVLVAIAFNYFQKMMRHTYIIFKDAAGIFYEDRFVPIIESVINIIASIILAKLIGLPGIFIGTIISGLALWCYSYPKYVYKKLFNRSYLRYIIETSGYILCFVLIAAVSVTLSMFLSFSNVWLQLISNICIVVIVPNILIVALFLRSDNFNYCIKLACSSLKSLKQRIKNQKGLFYEK